MAWWLPGGGPGLVEVSTKGVGMPCFGNFAGWVCWERAGIAVGLSGFWRFNAKLLAGGFNPTRFEKYDSSNWMLSPKIGVKIRKMKYLGSIPEKLRKVEVYGGSL